MLDSPLAATKFMLIYKWQMLFWTAHYVYTCTHTHTCTHIGPCSHVRTRVCSNTHTHICCSCSHWTFNNNFRDHGRKWKAMRGSRWILSITITIEAAEQPALGLAVEREITQTWLWYPACYPVREDSTVNCRNTYDILYILVKVQ